ncbi:TonB-dependent receptor [Gilvimarinus xylanilyticus]|uniref:TonB-dependent receptor n=1 Tax=Gilvimarinus xylanilyticus TaxID=2944139 RepID=A0A9X2I1M6_9GAMM|nr:TonB-dependent receptor [Gilvimarinus xylanilyticus]MCP8900984.1 TonB-dependent receptor [Gilvimarinus xylanilyticus]
MRKSHSLFARKSALALAIGVAAAGQYTYAQESTDAAAEDELLLEEVIVRGVRQSQAKAIDIKRDSDRIVDSIVAEDIGKLPDLTITDSLQRVTGVQITREANEGTSLNIRGMPQVLTTLNGEQFLSPWSITGVGANYSDIPAGMINGVDVYKSQSASMVAGGISGVVDLKTLSPLAMDEGVTANLRAEGSMGSRSKDEVNPDGSTSTRDPDYNVSGFFGFKLNDDVAFNLGLFSSETYNANYSMYENPQFGFLDRQNGTPTDPMDFDGDGDLENDWYLVPGSYGASSSFVTREREGGSASIEWQINDNFNLRGDAFYTRMDQYNRGVRVAFNGNSAVSSYSVNGTPGTESSLYDVLEEGSQFSEGGQFSYVDENGESQTATIHSLRVADVLAPDFTTTSSNDINKTAALNTNIQLDYTNHDNLTVTARYIYSEAEKRHRNASLQQGTPAWEWVDVDGIPGKDPIDPYEVTVDYTGDYPSFNFAKDVSDANLLGRYQAIATGDNTEGTLNVARVDANFEFSDTDFFRSVDFGVRYGVREADYAQYYYVTPTERYPNDQRIPIDKRNQLYSGNRVWQRYPDWRLFNYDEEPQELIDAGLYNNGFTAADTSVFTDFGPFSGFEGGVSALDPAQWDSPLAFMNRLYPGTRTVEDPAYAYNVEEASAEVFGQLNFGSDTGLFGVPYSGNFGLKVMQTDRTVERNTVPEVLDVFNSIGAVDYQKLAFVYDIETKERSFTQYLPSFNMNMFPADDVVVRFAAARTTSRNDLQNVGSGLSLWYSTCEKTDENGDRVLIVDSSGNLVGEEVTCVGGGSDQGDINIDPWLADVYNTSAEWYFDENAIIGLGLFYMDVDTSVQSFQERRRFVDGDGVDRGNNANVWVSENVKGSSLYGVEFGYRQPFTFLPSFLSSTGIEFNYTYSHSESNNEDLEGNSLPLPSNSAHQSNLILWYDNAGFNGRIAYNWRSEEYQGYAGLNTSGVPVNLANWGEPAGYLDLSMSYWINEHVSLYANGTNLTATDRRSYAQYEDQLQNIWVQERRYAVGVTLTY